MTPSRSVLIAPLAVVAVLAVAVLLLTGGSARAATPTYADPAGTCAGLTPCYPTVQDAVFNAGPAPAVVNIFPGTYVEQVDLSQMDDGFPGNITLQALDAAGAAAVGTVTVAPVTGHAIYESSFPFPGSVTINGIIAISPDSSSIEISASGNLSFSGVTVSGGGGDGADLDTQGDITIANSIANDNSNGGFNLEAQSSGTITVTGSQANNNSDSEGFDIETDGDISVTGTEASANWDEGFEIDGWETSQAGTVTMSDIVANDSESDDGVDVDADNATIKNVTANNNGDEGIQTIVSGDTLIDQVTTIGNEGDGVDPEGESFDGYAAANVTVRNSNIQGNDSGIEMLETPTSVSGALLANSNVFCDNIAAGFTSLDDQPINAEGNWWGNATGPTHPSLPTGAGDDVLDGANPGALSALGTVDFDPFISTSSGSGSATVGLASAISFQFTGPGGTPALQEGPGDETGASPFTVTTDNGTATVGFITGGKLDVSLTAATVGTANVSVTGPCGLATAAFPVAVAAAVGTPAPTPVQLPTTGGAADANSSLPLSSVVALTALAMLLLSAAGFAWSRAR